MLSREHIRISIFCHMRMERLATEVHSWLNSASSRPNVVETFTLADGILCAHSQAHSVTESFIILHCINNPGSIQVSFKDSQSNQSGNCDAEALFKCAGNPPLVYTPIRRFCSALNFK